MKSIHTSPPIVAASVAASRAPRGPSTAGASGTIHWRESTLSVAIALARRCRRWPQNELNPNHAIARGLTLPRVRGKRGLSGGQGASGIDATMAILGSDCGDRARPCRDDLHVEDRRHDDRVDALKQRSEIRRRTPVVCVAGSDRRNGNRGIEHVGGQRRPALSSATASTAGSPSCAKLSKTASACSRVMVTGLRGGSTTVAGTTAAAGLPWRRMTVFFPRRASATSSEKCALASATDIRLMLWSL